MTKQIPKKHARNKFALFRQRYITHPKLIIFLLILLAIPILSFINSKYKDWDNAQMIKGIARDFPLLIEEIEKATGLDLQIKTDCMTTSEKFSTGVKTCEYIVSKVGENTEVEKGFDILKNSKKFPKYAEYDNGEGIRTLYRNKKSCQFRTQKSIYVSCIIGVRDANTQLALDVF